MKHLFVLLFSISILFAQRIVEVPKYEQITHISEETLRFISESEFPIRFYSGRIISNDVEFCMESYQMSSQGFYEAITSLRDFRAYKRPTGEPCKYMVIFGGRDLEGNMVYYYSYIIQS